jgi:hypothetical protein
MALLFGLPTEDGTKRNAERHPESDTHCGLIHRCADGGTDPDTQSDPEAHFHRPAPSV